MASKFLIDSHIHLFLEEHLTSLAWMTPDNPLNAQHSMHEYLSSVGRSSSSSSSTARQALGFVFVETDRKCHLASDDAGWAGPLAEFEFVNNVGTGRDARYRACAGKVLAIIPWAPVPSGRVAMGRYRECLEERSADTRLLKGFRYMLQSHPRGTMLCEPFVDSLRWMGEEGYVFELTVDCRGVGLWQLEESVEMLRRAHEGVPADKKLRVIVGAYTYIYPQGRHSQYSLTDPSRPPRKARSPNRAERPPHERRFRRLENAPRGHRRLPKHIHQALRGVLGAVSRAAAAVSIAGPSRVARSNPRTRAAVGVRRNRHLWPAQSHVGERLAGVYGQRGEGDGVGFVDGGHGEAAGREAACGGREGCGLGRECGRCVSDRGRGAEDVDSLSSVSIRRRLDYE